MTCSTTSISLTATGGGTYFWNTESSNSTITVSEAGTYSVTVTSANGCTATASVAIMITNNLVVTASNTGPYELGNTISLSASGGGFYTWRGPDDFLSTNANATILNATQVERGIYTVTVTNGSGCSATATTNVVVNPCSQMFKFDYVKAGPDFQFFFPITDGMNIAELPTLLSGTGIIATPICQLDTVNTASVRFQMTGPTPLFNRDVIENIYPYSPFENRWFQIFGPIFPPGEYTLTVTGYSEEFGQGIVMFEPQTIHFTITGSAPSIALVNPNISQICAGNSLNVSFETTGSFISGNKFEVQLSNANGSFELPLKIGESTTAGLVNCTIPGNIPAGNGYKIRVFATNPALMSSTFSSAFEINPRNLILQSPSDDISTMRNKTATEKITATNKVLIGGNSTYQAGRFVLLQTGFETNSGSAFKAEISGCAN